MEKENQREACLYAAALGKMDDDETLPLSEFLMWIVVKLSLDV
jgi:hypothetical protein